MYVPSSRPARTTDHRPSGPAVVGGASPGPSVCTSTVVFGGAVPDTGKSWTLTYAPSAGEVMAGAGGASRRGMAPLSSTTGGPVWGGARPRGTQPHTTG